MWSDVAANHKNATDIVSMISGCIFEPFSLWSQKKARYIQESRRPRDFKSSSRNWAKKIICLGLRIRRSQKGSNRSCNRPGQKADEDSLWVEGRIMNTSIKYPLDADGGGDNDGDVVDDDYDDERKH